MNKLLRLGSLLILLFLFNVPIVQAEHSYSACGYVFVKHDDDTWTVYKSGNSLATYGSGYSLSSLKERYCVKNTNR